jgi:methionine-rich copper-binding protein CopC
MIFTNPEQRHTLVRRCVISLTAALMIMAVQSLGSSPAHGHAELLGVRPEMGAELKRSPRSVTVTFNEAVTAAASAIELLDSSGKVVARSAAERTAESHTVRTPVLRKGRYVLRWVVDSADGHPVVAASAFSVNTPTRASRGTAVSFTHSGGDVVARIDGARVGRRTVTIDGLQGEGVLELRHPSFKAPIVWSLQQGGATLRAVGMLPAAGSWQLTLKLRTGPFDQITATTTLRVTS